jgi:hypothetical protein
MKSLPLPVTAKIGDFPIANLAIFLQLLLAIKRHPSLFVGADIHPGNLEKKEIISALCVARPFCRVLSRFMMVHQSGFL